MTKWNRKTRDLVRAKQTMRDKDSPLITLSHTLSHTLSQLNYLYISTLYYIVTKMTKYLSNKFKYNVD